MEKVHKEEKSKTDWKAQSVVVLGFIFLWAFIWPSMLLAEVPKEINYQGYLTDADRGNHLDGTYDMRFHIYNDPIDGNELWNEDQSALITDGVFDVSLGAAVPISEIMGTPRILCLSI